MSRVVAADADRGLTRVTRHVPWFNEHDDAKETQSPVEEAGQQCVLMPGENKDPAHRRAIAGKAIETFGTLDVLVNNAARHASFTSIDEQSWPSGTQRQNSIFASRNQRKLAGAAEMGPLIANTAISNRFPGETISRSTTRFGILNP